MAKIDTDQTTYSHVATVDVSSISKVGKFPYPNLFVLPEPQPELDTTVFILESHRINNIMYSGRLHLAAKDISPNAIITKSNQHVCHEIREIANKKYLSFLDDSLIASEVDVFDIGAVKSIVKEKSNGVLSDIVEVIDISTFPINCRDISKFFAFVDGIFTVPVIVNTLGSRITVKFSYLNKIQIYAGIPDDIIIARNLPANDLIKMSGYIPVNVHKISPTGTITKLSNPDTKYYPYFILDRTEVSPMTYIYKRIKTDASKTLLEESSYLNLTRIQDIEENAFLQSRYSENFITNLRDLDIDWSNFTTPNSLKLIGHLKKFKDVFNHVSGDLRRDRQRIVYNIQETNTLANVLLIGSQSNVSMYVYDEDIHLLYQDVKNNIFFSLNLDDTVELKGSYNSSSKQFLESVNGTAVMKFIKIRSSYLNPDYTKIVSIRKNQPILENVHIQKNSNMDIRCKKIDGSVAFDIVSFVNEVDSSDLIKSFPDAEYSITRQNGIIARSLGKYDRFTKNAGALSYFNMMNKIESKLVCICNGRLFRGDSTTLSNLISLGFVGNVIYNKKLVDDIFIFSGSDYIKVEYDTSLLDADLLSRGIINLNSNVSFSPFSDMIFINDSLVDPSKINWVLGKSWFTVEGYNMKDPAKFNGKLIESIVVYQQSQLVTKAIVKCANTCDSDYYNNIPQIAIDALKLEYPVTGGTSYTPSTIDTPLDTLHGPSEYLARIFEKVNPIERLMEIGDDPVRIAAFKQSFMEEFAMMNVDSIFNIQGADSEKIIINFNTSPGGKFDPT